MFSIGESDDTIKIILLEYAKMERIEQLMESIELKNSFGLVVRLWEGGSFLIRLSHNKNKAKFKATVSHEIFHMAHSLLSGVGMKLSDDSEEAYAYLIGYVTEQFYNNL
jgi:hypothetical protein